MWRWWVGARALDKEEKAGKTKENKKGEAKTNKRKEEEQEEQEEEEEAGRPVLRRQHPREPQVAAEARACQTS